MGHSSGSDRIWSLKGFGKEGAWEGGLGVEDGVVSISQVLSTSDPAAGYLGAAVVSPPPLILAHPLPKSLCPPSRCPTRKGLRWLFGSHLELQSAAGGLKPKQRGGK